MGYMRNHGITVSTFLKDKAELAHSKAIEIFGVQVSEILTSPVNEYYTFLVGPDGSKEGWSPSDEGDGKRQEFVEWLNKQAYEDGSNPLGFVEYFYNDEEGEAEIVSHN